MNRLNIDSFKKYFEDKEFIEATAIADFYNSFEKPIKLATIHWRIHSLVQKGVLQRVGRGKFRLGEPKAYIPEISLKLKSIYKKIHEEFPFTELCVWHTSIFNEFMRHQAGKFCYLIEVEKASAEAVFYFLKEEKITVFLNPNQEILDKYIPENKNICIIQALVSEAPTQKIGEICTISVEKMLVDIFCNKTLFATQQGAEMRTIFNEALGKYTVNQSKMLRYADRRKKKEGFSNYLKTISKYRQ